MAATETVNYKGTGIIMYENKAGCTGTVYGIYTIGTCAYNGNGGSSGSSGGGSSLYAFSRVKQVVVVLCMVSILSAPAPIKK